MFAVKPHAGRHVDEGAGEESGCAKPILEAFWIFAWDMMCQADQRASVVCLNALEGVSDKPYHRLD